jgi:NarL family two-component system sensor histidine kinase YdfH
VGSKQPAAETFVSEASTGPEASTSEALAWSETSAWLIAFGGALAGCLLSTAIERRATRALAHERRRVAADVHDLVMQDLSLALANARTLAGEQADTPRANLVVSAGERALAGARVVLSGLTEDGARDSEPIVRAIQASAEAAARNTPLIFDAHGVPGSARPDRPTREALVHIAREAVTNATKHTRSDAILLTLQYTDQWHLTVRDEGNGFDAESKPHSFGLISMRTHVQALGGVLNISSASEQGTTVEVMLP